MVDADVSHVRQSARPIPLTQQVVDVGQVARRLSYAINSTVQALYTIVNMQTPETQTMRQLVQKMYALAAALSSLCKDLVESGEDDVWTKEHGESLLHSMNECNDIVRAIVRAVREADKTFNAPPKPTMGGDYSRAFLWDNVWKAVDVIDKCFELVAQTNLVARYETLARKEYLDENEVPEALRLIQAFERPVLGDIRACKDAPWTSEQVQGYLMPSPATPAFSASQTKDQPEPNSSTAPATESKEPTLRETVAVSAYNQWPPFGTPQHPAYLAATAERQKEDSRTAVKEPRIALAPISKVFSESGPSTSRPSTPGLTPQPEPGTISFGEPSVIKPTSSGSPLFGEGPFASYAKHDRSNINSFVPTPRLEAFILRPTVQSTDTSSTLSYRTEPLQLDEETMQAQIRKLGPDCSIMDSLLDLRPQQLHLIQFHARQRQGVIVSVQHGKPVDLSTPMGMLQVTSVIFTIKTTTAFPQDSFRAPDPKPIVSDKMPIVGRDRLGDTLATGFKMPNTGSLFSCRHYLSSPEAYSQHLRERGEPCTYVEGTERKGAFQCYQTITTNPQWHKNDRSLEEIRLADYSAGRKGPMKTNNKSYLWDEPKGLFGQGRFGDLKSTPSTGASVSKTGWFPTSPIPSAGGFTLYTHEPKKGVFDQYISNPSSTSPLSAFGNSGSNRGPFSHVAPQLPPFVPPQGSWAVASSGLTGRNAFRSNAWDAWRSAPGSSSTKPDAPSAVPFFGQPVLGTSASKHPFRTSTESKDIGASQHQHAQFDRVPQPHPLPQGPLARDEIVLPSGAASEASRPPGTSKDQSHPDECITTACEVASPSSAHFGSSPSVSHPSFDSMFKTAPILRAPTIADSFGPPAVTRSSGFSLFGAPAGASNDESSDAEPTP